MKARRGDLSGPVLAILVTLVLLAIGAAIIAYFVLLGTAPQHGVVAVVGQPTIARSGLDNFIANVTIKNVGSATITLEKTDVQLNIIGTIVPADYISRTTLPPGATATIGFLVRGWDQVADRDTVSGALIVPASLTIRVVFRVIRAS